MTRIACIGECMIELTEDEAGGPGAMRRGYGGDTLNSAVYLARELAGLDSLVSYVTVLGDDEYSSEMLEGWAAGIGATMPPRDSFSLQAMWHRRSKCCAVSTGSISRASRSPS
jgi:2-dehydro-3-deoxygluconokinase